MENNIQNFDEKYQIKSEIEHILDRPGMWVGSMITEVTNYLLYVPSQNKIKLVPNIGYNPALLKLVDEVLTNSIDEHRKKDALFQVTKINVTANIDGTIIIEDNGGIPVQIHKGTNLIIPEMLFGHLRTSSNYDDTKEREWAGTNGLGSKLTNVFSTSFQVKTSDSKKGITIDWSNNMGSIKKSEIINTTNHGTITTFKIDLERFEFETLPTSVIRIIQKRCIDAAAANPGLIVDFKSDAFEGKLDSSWKFESFTEYMKLYLTDEQIKQIMFFQSKRDTILLLPENIGFNFGFVNGVICSEGTHIKKIEKQIVDKILDYCGKNDMELITEKDITNRMSIFVNCTIINPKYDSQTKDKLTTKIDKFVLNFSNEFLYSLEDSLLMENLKTYYEVKYAEEKKKETKKLNSLIKSSKTKKLISCPSTSSEVNELWLFEGNSASNGFRNARNLYQAAYLLRGKITNTFDLKKTQIVENVELREILAALGILFDDAKNNVKNCKFSKIIIGSDMDYDGNHICGLLLAFFAKHFPELIRAGKIYRALSPIIVCSKDNKKQYFYTVADYKAVENTLKGWEINYTKGLGGLDDYDYREMVRNQKLIQFTIEDIQDIDAVSVWFGKSSELRKQILLEDENVILEDIAETVYN